MFGNRNSDTAGRGPAVPLGRRIKGWLFLIMAAVAIVIAVVNIAPGAADFALRVLLGGLVVVCAVLGFRVGAALVIWKHRREVLIPVHAALSVPGLLPALADRRPESYLRVSPYRTEGQVVRIKLPPEFAGEDGLKDRVARTIETKLGIPDLTWKWKLAGAEPYATAAIPVRPPTSVRYSDQAFQAILADRRSSEVLLGLTRGSQGVTVDLDSESPHILVSAGSGGGKSVTVRAIVSPILQDGGVCAFADRKMTSHRWAKKLAREDGPSNIEYACTIGEIHELLINAGGEGDRRRLIVDGWSGSEDDPRLAELVGPRFVLVIEEGNATIQSLKKYWQKIRTKDDPKESPALDALADIMFMGRAFRMHVVIVAQSATAQALGGPEIRENLACRIIARHTKNQWMMLVPEIGYRKPSRKPGRAYVCLAGEASETQIVFYTEDESEALAREGLARFRAWVDKHGVSDVPVVSDPAHSHGKSTETPRIETEGVPVAELGSGDPQDPAVAELLTDPRLPDGGGAVTLREASELLSDISYHSLRKYASSDRDPDFPDPIGKSGKANLYNSTELLEWWANRGGSVAL